jgi:hypothetical protein
VASTPVVDEGRGRSGLVPGGLPDPPCYGVQRQRQFRDALINEVGQR